MLGASWRTSSGGAVLILGAVGVLITQAIAYLDGDVSTVFNLQAVIEALGMIGGGLGLWHARDDKVSTEQANHAT